MIINSVLGLFRNVHFQSLFGNGLMAAIGMLSFSILYRGLSAHDVGVYVLFTSLLVLVDTSRTGFLTVGFITFFSGTARQRGQAVAGSAWYLATAITACAILLNLVVSALF